MCYINHLLTKMFIFMKYYSFQIGFITVKNNTTFRAKNMSIETSPIALTPGNQLVYKWSIPTWPIGNQ